MPSLRNSPSGQFSLGSNGTVLARLLRTITRFRKPLGLKGFCAPALPSPPYPPSRHMVAGQTECTAPGYAMRSVGHRSALRCPMQRAGIILAASRNLRLQVADGRTKPSDGHTKTAYVHPKTANGDFTKHPEDFHHAAGTDSEGWRETSESGKTSIRRQQDIRSETIKASADVRLHTSGCLLDDKREGTTPPLAAAFYPRVN